MKTRDVITDDVVIYKSVSEMAVKLGMSVISANNYINKLPGYLYNRRYEIKLFTDKSSWYFEDNEYDSNDYSKSIFTITTFNKITCEIKRFLNVKSFYRAYNLWTKSGTLEDGISAFQLKYPDFDISYKRNSITGPYQVLNLQTKQICIFDSIIKIGEYINKSRTELQYDLCRRLKFIYSKKWLIANINEEIVFEDYKDKPKPFNKIVITNNKSDTKIIANSIRDANKITGLDLKTITKNLNTDIFVKGLNFRALE